MKHSTLAAVLLFIGSGFILFSVPADASLVGLPLGLVLDAVGFVLIGIAVLGLGAKNPVRLPKGK